MPRTFKESMLYATLMCGLMVIGMSTWNLALHGAFTWGHLLLGLLPGFVVAFILDTILVGPIAKRVAFSFLPPTVEKPIVKILAITICMVIGMVSCMSLYGLLVSGQPLTLGNYMTTWILNFVAALPYNLLIAGPIARFILGKYQAAKLTVA